jgi:glycosyltransferase involved in cell wall biosynthesis
MARILMVAYTHYLTDARPRREAEAFAGRGDDVEFIGLSEENRPVIEEINGVRIFRIAQKRFRGSSTVSYLFSYAIFFVMASFRVVTEYFRKNYDVIYVHTMPDWMVFVGLVPKFYGAKIILNMHDMMPELYMSKFGVGEDHFLIRLMKFQERQSFNFADRVICVHEPHGNVLIARGIQAEKLTVVLNVPDPRVFGSNDAVVPPSPATAQPRFVYHGTIAERLGLDIAVEAFVRVLEVYPEARFDVYGDGDYGARLEALIQKNGLAGRMNFSRKFFHVDEVPSLIRGATVGVICNRRDRATEYMLPVKLIEYVYLGIPVVAPDLMVIRHYFTDDAVAYFNPGDAAELANRLIELCRDESKRLAYAQRAKAFVSMYSWDRLKEDLFKTIEN